jgi:hypothetical protein
MSRQRRSQSHLHRVTIIIAGIMVLGLMCILPGRAAATSGHPSGSTTVVGTTVVGTTVTRDQAAVAGYNRVQPSALTYLQGSYPVNQPRPQFEVENLSGYSHGFPPILNYGAIDDNQLWSSAAVTGTTVVGTTVVGTTVTRDQAAVAGGAILPANQVISSTSNFGEVVVVAVLAMALCWSCSLLGRFPTTCRWVTATGTV